MSAVSVILGVYLAVLGLLSLNGLHRLGLIVAVLKRAPEVGSREPEVWPTVLVQLPLFNERDVAERIVMAATALDYAPGRMVIQVLDDSTDDTVAQTRALVARLAAAGVPITHLHRENRVGFKAGALQAGLEASPAELVVVFDADFMPQPEFLRLAVPVLVADPGVGMVQARWGHENLFESWLTLAQGALLDGHFVVEHQGRFAAGNWFNFNGTAGVWRSEAIRQAGGWSHDTLTEDLDLSYRAQLAGWRFVYLDGLVVPAELPTTMKAFAAQQHRWAKGAVQTGRKLLGRVWRSHARLGTKLEATAHLTANTSYPLVVLLSALMPLAFWARLSGAQGALVLADAVLFVLAVVPFVGFYGLAVWRSGSERRGLRLLCLPVALALGLGMALSQSRALWEGLTGPVGEFVRTPKRGAGRGSYQAQARALVVVELAMAAWLWGAVGLALSWGEWASVPFLMLFASGYSLTGLGSLRG